MRRGYTVLMNDNDNTALRGLLKGLAFSAAVTGVFVAAMLAVRIF